MVVAKRVAASSDQEGPSGHTTALFSPAADALRIVKPAASRSNTCKKNAVRRPQRGHFPVVAHWPIADVHFTLCRSASSSSCARMVVRDSRCPT